MAEVLYNDECFFRVYDGRDGTVLYERANSSRTGTEFPLVVDVDGDNNSEIVVPSNSDGAIRDGCDLATRGREIDLQQRPLPDDDHFVIEWDYGRFELDVDVTCHRQVQVCLRYAKCKIMCDYLN